MTKLKAGQIRKIGEVIVRCKKRVNGCKGCVLDDMILCPRMGKNQKDYVSCIEDGIIFVTP